MVAFSLATNKNCPYKDPEVIMDLPWAKFKSIQDWVNFNDAREYAITKDAHTKPNNT